jgi:glycosyltransferase involved in cell wall biosynthesis
MTGNGHKLLVVIPIAVLCRGGTEAQTLHLIKALKPYDYEIQVVCFYESDPEVIKDFENNGTQVILLNQLRRGGKFQLLMTLYRFYREQKPAVVHVQYVEQGLIALATAWLAGVPVRFATVHQMGTSYGYRQKLLLHIAARLTTMFLCVSLAVERSWFGDGAVWNPVRQEPRRHWTIYDCTDVALVRSLAHGGNNDALRRRYGLRSGPVIGVVGRTSREKGQMVLMQALPLIMKSFRDVQVLLVGENYLQDDIMANIEEYGLQQNVVMTGRLSQEEVYRLYSLMDVVAVPSLVEGFGLTAIEAMAAGKPVVASHVGGLAEIVEDGVTGTLVEPQNHQSLATAIIRFLETPGCATEFGAAGLRKVSAMFSLDGYRKEIRSLYEWAIGVRTC